MWADTLIGFDLETSGTDVEQDRIVTATVIEFDIPAETSHTTNWLADPGIDIPAAASAVHGITTEHAREHGRPAVEVVTEVASRLSAVAELGMPLVVYNAPYDLSLLDRECRRYGLPPLDVDKMRVVDPLVIDKAVDRYRKGSRKLLDVAAHYGVTLTDDDAHTSAGDAVAAVLLTMKLAELFPGELADLDDLQTRQAKWRREQAESFESYLRRIKARDGATREEIAAVSIPRDWPLRPFHE